ncbi:Metallo-dependent phosphatase, partial [Dacryopinax primogenitus]
MPPGDVLLHAGDLSRWGKERVLEEAVEWLVQLQYPVKLVIAGNHDSLLDDSLPPSHQPSSPSAVTHFRQLLTSPRARKANIHYLQYSSYTFSRPGGRKWTVWGSPGSPAFGTPAFQYAPWEAAALYARMPEEVDILLTHTPPLGEGTLDLTSKGVHAGCPELARRVKGMARGPWMHVFGHIHEGWGWDVCSPETVRQEREEVEKEREMGSGMGKGKKGRRGKWHKKSPSVELEASLADLSISTSTWRAGHSRSPSAPASLLPPLPVAATTAPSEEVKDRWGLSVNAALGRMHSDGHTKKGPRAPIVVDFWEEAMDLERAP